MNTQPIEKYVDDMDGRLEVHSVFHTIQGEGPFCGTPSVFVRLAGCNLRCPACDTDYTSTREVFRVGELVDEVWGLRPPPALVVITGGEPFRQNIGPFIRKLLEVGYYVQVETNGTLPPPGAVDWASDTSARKGAYIVCSPKTGKLNPRTSAHACCFKYVLRDNPLVHEDGLPYTALGHSAAPHLARPPADAWQPIYLQPQDDKDPEQNKRNIDAVVRACMKHGYILQLQIHKYIGVE